MDITITPGRLSGTITPPPSKSQAHRLMIAAALAQGESVISNVAFSQDIEATLGCMKALGARAETDGSTVTITGVGSRRAHACVCSCGALHLDCGESGSTLRFLIPVALAVAGDAFFTGRGRLLARPQKPYADLFAEKGVFFAHEAQAITVGGQLTPGRYALPGNVSSQFVTGLLYALPLLEGDSEIVLTSPLESRGYVDMTLDALERFGVRVEAREGGYSIPGGQSYRPCSLAVEADWSQAGFWFAAAALGNRLDVRGMKSPSIQGDWRYLDLYEQMCAAAQTQVDVSQHPDLVPPLAAAAALEAGRTVHLTNAARLRIKESDRLASVTQVLNALGADVTEGPDFLTIRGKEMLTGGVSVDSFNDHRIAMMAAIAATRCEKPVAVLGAECVAKSYPNFWEDYASLGGVIEKTN